MTCRAVCVSGVDPGGKLAAACGAEVEFFPILLGGLFRSIGDTDGSDFDLSGKQAAARAGGHESLGAHHYGVSFHFPSRFPINTVAALRLLLLAGDNIAPLTHTLFRLYWVGDQDLGDVQVLERALSEVGLDPRLVDRVGEPEGQSCCLPTPNKPKSGAVSVCRHSSSPSITANPSCFRPRSPAVRRKSPCAAARRTDARTCRADTAPDPGRGIPQGVRTKLRWLSAL